MINIYPYILYLCHQYLVLQVGNYTSVSLCFVYLCCFDLKWEKKDWCFISHSKHWCPFVQLQNKSLITSVQHTEHKSLSRSIGVPCKRPSPSNPAIKICLLIKLSLSLWVCARVSGLRRFLDINMSSFFLSLFLIFVITFRSLSYLPFRQSQMYLYQLSWML